MTYPLFFKKRSNNKDLMGTWLQRFGHRYEIDGAYC